MAYKSLMFEMVVECPKCTSTISVPGIVDRLVCKKCGAQVSTPIHYWRRVLTDVTVEALGFPEGKGRSGLVRATPPVKLVFGRMVTRCSQCKEVLPAMGILTAAREGAPKVYCPFCGHPNNVRAAPPWFDQIHPAISAIVNEAVAPEEQADRTFNCFACGAVVPAGPDGTPQRCQVCGERVSMPGATIRKISQPASPRTRFFLLADLGNSSTVATHSVQRIVDFGVEPYGRMVLAWHPRLSTEARQQIGLIDPKGALNWVNNEINFSTSSTLHACPASGQIVLVDKDSGGIHELDAKDGSTSRLLAAGDPESELIDVRDAVAFSIDTDGTRLVGRLERGAMRLRRFAPDGRRLPLWTGMTIDEEERQGREAPVQTWASLTHRMVLIPPGVEFATGWDAHSYLLDKESGSVAKLDRDGTFLGRVQPEPGVVQRAKGVAVDAQGNVLLLFAHADPVDGALHDHVARLMPNGSVHLILGVHARAPDGGGSSTAARDLGRMKVMPDGTIFLGGELDQLRIVSATGRILWESAEATARNRVGNEPSVGSRRDPSLWG
ncbi:MAG: hypothetical protein AAGF12_27800 [Myxococcota bacterium]